jgi:signal transduction histidine kinase
MEISSILNLIAPILTMIVLLFALIKKVFQKDAIAIILSIAWIPLLVMIIFFYLNQIYSLIDVYLLTDILLILFVIETMFISLIVIYKMKLAEVERNDLLLFKKEQEIVSLRQSRLASMGEMLNNIAHQWKQPLNRINAISFDMYTTYTKNELDENCFLSKLDLIENETSYMAQTISSFTSYFHPHKKEESFSLRKTIKKQIISINRSLDTDKELDVKIELLSLSKNVKILGFEKEYEQVIRVIVDNAIDIFKLYEIKNPTIIFIIDYIDDKPRLTIKNNGPKIKEKNISKIFDPYFTTKHKSKGTGIGLYMSKMLIENSMNKSLTVKNTKDGVIFEIIG